MINLYFMRHGIAADRINAGATSDDRKRPLTPKGVKRVQKAAKGLLSLSLSFDRILTSPLERACRTARIVAETLHMQNCVEEIQELSPGRTVQELLSALAAYRKEKNILLVGHEPLLSRAVSSLLSETSSKNATSQIRLKKGGLCCLEVDGLPPKESAVLHWALTPKQLRLLAR